MTAAPEPATRPGAAKTPLPPVFRALWLGTLVNRLATFVAPFLMLYLVRDRGVAPVTASALLTVQGAGLALSNVAGGWLADRVGRRGTMIAGLATTAGIMALLPSAGPLWTVAVLVAALGLTADLHRPALNAFVADVVAPDERARAYSMLHWATNLGLTAALAGGGLIAEASYAWLFRLDAATTLGFALVVWWLVPRDGHDRRPPPGDPAQGRSPWRDPRLLAFSVITFLVFLVFFQNFVTLPLAVTDLGLTAADFGLVLAVNGVAVAILQPLTAARLKRFRPGTALAAGYLLIGAGYGLVAFATDVPALAGTVLVWGLGEIVVVAVGTAYVASLVPAHTRGRYLGVYGAAMAAAVAAAPLAGTLAYDVHPDALWFGCAAVGVLTAAWQLRLGRAPAR
ncbi:MDR family MFS transporter [Actinophytocola sp. KF-1]